jgi:hypothetical protein
MHGPGNDVGRCSVDIDDDTIFIGREWFQGVKLGGKQARGHEVICAGADSGSEELGTAAEVQKPHSRVRGP